MNGIYGKGEKENYASFCKYCFREYPECTEICVHCKKATQSCIERRAYLLKKAHEYQTGKVRKEERKKKWQLWKNTQAMLWKKTATNYSKWDYFTSSSEDEDIKTDPIVPSNDPNFKAMEMDMNDRAKRRK